MGARRSDGGGISANTATLTKCSINGDSACTGGGIAACTARLDNCTVAENLVQNGGGFSATGGGTFRGVYSSTIGRS